MTRLALVTALAILSSSVPRSAVAQRAPGVRLELRSFAGSYVPLGHERSAYRSAPMAGVQFAVEASPALHLVTSSTWTSARARFAGPGAGLEDLWLIDAGVEYTPKVVPLRAVAVRPFVGIGGGGRAYDKRRALPSDDRCAAGYGALGSEVAWGGSALRLEGRGYVSCAREPQSLKKSMRADVGLDAGLALHLW